MNSPRATTSVSRPAYPVVDDTGLRIHAWQSTPACWPFRRTGLAASTRSPTPWPSGTARRRRGSWPNAKARRSLTSCVWRRRRGSRSFQARPPWATSCFSRRRNREICPGLLLLSAFQSQDVGYRGAMVKEKPGVLPGLLFGLGFGGFVDGIVLGEIFQWHQMISGAQSSETLAASSSTSWLTVLPRRHLAARHGRFHHDPGVMAPRAPCALHGRFTSGCWWPGGASSTSLKD